MRNSIKIIIAMLITSIFQACSTYTEKEKEAFSSKAVAYAEKHHWKFTTQDGVAIELLEQGTGNEKIQLGSEISISYKGTLSNGTVFDQTEPGKPLVSKLDGLIQGFQYALLNQVAGTKMRLAIPPQHGYGDKKFEKIPENSLLIFELTIEAVY